MATKKAGAPTHPPYAEMITEAIVQLKERSGSSLPAIKKYVAQYKLPEGWEKKLSLFLKKMTTEGKLLKVKASWKLGNKGTSVKPKKPATMKVKTAAAKPATAKKPKKPKAKKTKTAAAKKATPAGKSKVPAKAKTVLKKVAPKKAAPKKAAPKKAAPKKAPKKTTKKATPKAK